MNAIMTGSNGKSVEIVSGLGVEEVVGWLEELDKNFLVD